MSARGRRCDSYEPANPEYIEDWLEARADLIDPEAILAWLGGLYGNPASVAAERAPDPFGIYGYEVAYIEDQAVDVMFVVVDSTCEIYVRRLTHISEMPDPADELP